MKVTTITYQRVLNLGDYNSARLEKTAQADEHEDQEVATQNLIESVERQIHEKAIHNKIDQEIRNRKKELASLITEYAVLKDNYESLNNQYKLLEAAQEINNREGEDSDIPFKSEPPEFDEAVEDMNKYF
ncbi:hypothetical protein [Nostoc sp.]|uniref:hypothetical protein n=1 Tax=Nostoc sp. TaxID=1180 RepID=UPI002FFB57E7